MELLAPAGSYESLKAAVNAGADAVYIGGSRFGARAYADNPGEEELLRGIDYCHIRKRKIYLTVNTLLKEQELEQELYNYVLPYYKEGLDGVIVQDFGVMSFLKRNFPLLPLHASTQMTVTGADGAGFLARQGVVRVVTARELSLKEIRDIIEQTGIEAETFVHGAMCYSYSGQCLFSSMVGGRSGNRGRCAQPCRLQYSLYDRQGRQHGCTQHLLSLKDMCALELLPELADAGVASLKIEGRMKRPEYTAGVVSIYRKYLDLCLGGHRFQVDGEDKRILLDLYNRGGFTQGYFHMRGDPSMMAMQRPNHQGSSAARVRKKGNAVQAVASCRLERGDVLEAAPARPGQKGAEMTVKDPVEKNGIFRLPPSFSKAEDGQELFRTHNEALLKAIGRDFIDTECKEKINGILIISPGKPVILKITCGTYEVWKQGGLAEQALHQPVTEDNILRQLRKTGNSPFVFSNIEIRMEGEVFFPLQLLNQLRRGALDELEERILADGKRESADGRQEADSSEETACRDRSSGASLSERRRALREENGNGAGAQSFERRRTFREENESGAAAQGFRLTVSVQEAEQLEEVQKRAEQGELLVDTVYLDVGLIGEDAVKGRRVCAAREGTGASSLPAQGPGHSGAAWLSAEKAGALAERLHRCGIRCFLQMPPVFRKDLRECFCSAGARQALSAMDGFLVRTADALAFLLNEGYTQPIVGDEGLYACNREAAAFLLGQGVSRLTLPVELTMAELASLGCAGKEMLVYGRIPLMFTAQCLRKNTGGCTGVSSLMLLKDRKNMIFPVRMRCRECCNVIYNSVPLNLLPCEKEIRRLGPSHLRLSFTAETADEAGKILSEYSDFLSEGRPAGSGAPGTRGHFRRGVE